jgi:DNA-binding NtrC family response regulator
MSRPRAILVVDDEPSVRTLLDSLLRRAGFQVHLASDAGQALELFRSLELDVVIADVVMPGMDGVTLLEQLIGLNTSVPVVLMTGFGAIDAAVDAMRRGAADYITKPFKRQTVLGAIERALARRERQEGAGAADEAGEESEPKSFEQSVLEFALDNRMTLREVGDLYIDRVLSLSGGNKVQAARRLGINRRTLYRRGGAKEQAEDESGA